MIEVLYFNSLGGSVSTVGRNSGSSANGHQIHPAALTALFNQFGVHENK
jgi:hypothetical protein